MTTILIGTIIAMALGLALGIAIYRQQDKAAMKCFSCRRFGTKKCPRIDKCYATKDKPYYSPKNEKK